MSQEPVRLRPLIGVSQAFREVVRLVDLVAKSDCCVLIEGESGVGKDLLARRLHTRSRRCEGPFIPVNCAGVSETLFDSQFFGHVRGAFTGAEQTMLGLIRTADGGTLFMDEVGDIPLEMQPKLLRAIQEGEVMPVGTSTPVCVDTRFIAATHRRLHDEVAQGRFREDLYYRLNVVGIRVPPLRECPEDIPVLLAHFLTDCARRYGTALVDVGRRVQDRLCRHGWPGNVRELQSWVERLYATQAPPEALADVLSGPKEASSPPVAPNGQGVTLADAEREAIRQAMESTGHNCREAARLLQIHRSTLYRKLREYSLA